MMGGPGPRWMALMSVRVRLCGELGPDTTQGGVRAVGGESRGGGATAVG